MLRIALVGEDRWLVTQILCQTRVSHDRGQVGQCVIKPTRFERVGSTRHSHTDMIGFEHEELGELAFGQGMFARVAKGGRETGAGFKLAGTGQPPEAIVAPVLSSVRAGACPARKSRGNGRSRAAERSWDDWSRSEQPWSQNVRGSRWARSSKCRTSSASPAVCRRLALILARVR